MMGIGLLLPVLLIGAVAYAAGWRPQLGDLGRPTTGETAKNALDILRERYARGEISAEEYERTRADLTR